MYPGSGDKSPTAQDPAPKGAGSSVVPTLAGAIAYCDASDGGPVVRCAAIELPADPPEWIHLMTPGQLNARDGRRFQLDDAVAVVRDSLARSANLVVDYEHQTDLAEKNGQPAPAAGWIKDLSVRPDGIWGRVEWTAKAADMIRAREYRFLSPTFTHAKTAPHQVRIILRAALTNNPALELTALATNQDGDPEMDKFLLALVKALGLGADVNQDQILAALTEKLGGLAQLTTLATAVRSALALDDKADDKAIAAAIDKLKSDVATATAKGTGADPDPAKYVPIAQVTALSEQIARLTATVSDDKATTAVEQAMKDGKVPPALKDWATAYAKSDLGAFTAYCTNQPAIFKPGSDVPTTVVKTAADALSETDKAIARATGIDETAFLATRKKELEASA
ncbi:MAG: hypothetical protein COW30_02540 [Rhodospirillales bacterium CG15_BIG_FIL_POST_REV_8_21_14_020_66_15]|nr:MAG: hypothetical protein COW30_02540 [Rhodospirillales bacterium CG15_BIG_FIL_POST_REV_8_21_14_020_66_15]